MYEYYEDYSYKHFDIKVSNGVVKYKMDDKLKNNLDKCSFDDTLQNIKDKPGPVLFYTNKPWSTSNNNYIKLNHLHFNH